MNRLSFSVQRLFSMKIYSVPFRLTLKKRGVYSVIRHDFMGVNRSLGDLGWRSSGAILDNPYVIEKENRSMRTNFFRPFRFAAVAAVCLLVAACSKKAEVQADSALDAKGEVKTAPPNATASGSVTTSTSVPAATAAPPPKTLVAFVNNGKGFVPLSNGGDVDLLLGALIQFDPPLAMDQVKVLEGPFKVQDSVNGAVVKYRPSETDLALLEKGGTVKVRVQVANLELAFQLKR